MPNVSIAVYVSPGRCPGLWATFGLTARPNHLPGVCANWFVFNRPLPRLGKGLKYVSSRALRIIFPEKPFNPALTRITACNQTGCECMVCTSNPSLMKGCVLSCNRFIYMQRLCLPGKHVHIHAPFLGIFGYARHSPNKFLKIRLLAMAKFE